MSGDNSYCHAWGRDAIGIYWVEARIAAKHPPAVPLVTLKYGVVYRSPPLVIGSSVSFISVLPAPYNSDRE